MCVFCSIINHEIPSKVVYEDDLVLAILDISQVTKGHTLVMPKKHVDNLLECDDETAAHLIQVVKHLAKRIQEKTGASGINICISTSFPVTAKTMRSYANSKNQKNKIWMKF